MLYLQQRAALRSAVNEAVRYGQPIGRTQADCISKFNTLTDTLGGVENLTFTCQLQDDILVGSASGTFDYWSWIPIPDAAMVENSRAIKDHGL